MDPKKLEQAIKDFQPYEIETISVYKFEDDGEVKHIITPLGAFSTLDGAAKANGYSRSYLMSLFKHRPDQYYRLPVVVVTPIGIFDSVKAAAKAFGKPNDYIYFKLKSKSKEFYKTLKETK